MSATEPLGVPGHSSKTSGTPSASLSVLGSAARSDTLALYADAFRENGTAGWCTGSSLRAPGTLPPP